MKKDTDKIKKILNKALAERNKVAKNTNDFNELEDEYKIGYYIAMNTIVNFIEKL